jgi:predicted Zn-ribbon and HTH transcriptional regulator
MDTLYDTSEAIRKVRKAFTMLRREGLQVQMRFVCCEQCGSPHLRTPETATPSHVLHGI